MWQKKKKLSIVTMVPDHQPIELVEYYEQFRDYYPNCEMATKHWFVNNINTDWIIFDCGANIGYFSILFAMIASNGHVFAFEPTNTYEMLLKNLEHHKLKNVTAFNLAIGKQTGLRDDNIFRIWGKTPEKLRYSFVTLDDFVKERNLSRIDCIKIDVDSFDFEVLQGAEQSLLKFNPYLMVELNHALNQRGQSNMQALEWLAQRGYEEAVVFDYDNFLLKRGSDWSKSRNGQLKVKIFFEQLK